MSGWTASQDALRVLAPSEESAGFVYAWLASPYGRLLFERLSAGSVVVHVDRFHLGALPLPWLCSDDRNAISGPVLASSSLRTSAWDREQRALKRLAELIYEHSSSLQKFV
jgi:type I restriction enzyme S subunit